MCSKSITCTLVVRKIGQNISCKYKQENHKFIASAYARAMTLCWKYEHKCKLNTAHEANLMMKKYVEQGLLESKPLHQNHYPYVEFQ